MKDTHNSDFSFTFNGEIPPTVPDGETYQVQFIRALDAFVTAGLRTSASDPRPRPSQAGKQESSRGSKRMP
jgi:hypothetical protein